MSISYQNKVNERLVGQSISSEPHTIGIVNVATVEPGFVRLVEVPQPPSPLSTIFVTGVSPATSYTEITSGSPTSGQFLVNYTTGVITFNTSQDGNTITVAYIGLGSEFAAEDVNELQGPVGVALNYNGSLSNNIVKPASISNTATDDFTFPRDVIVIRNLRTPEVTSTSSNPASTGVIRLAHSDAIAWRNFANSGDDVLASDGSDDLTWKGNVIATGAGAVTSITGTTNQIIASSATGAVTLSTPQNIATSSSPTFAGLSLTGDQTITVSDSSTTEILLALTNNGTGQAIMSFTANSATNYVGTNINGGFYMATAEPIGTNSFLFYAGGILQLASSGPINLEPTTNVVVANGSLSVTSGSVSGTSAFFGGSAVPSAILTLSSTTQGFLPPQMTSMQRTSISSPASGLIVYDITTNQLYLWNGTSWVILG